MTPQEQQIAALITSLNNLTAAQSQATRAVHDMTSSAHTASDEISDLARVGRGGRKLTEEELKIKAELIEAINHEISASRRKTQAEEALAVLNVERARQTRAERRDSTSSFNQQRTAAINNVVAARNNHAATQAASTALKTKFTASLVSFAGKLPGIIGLLAKLGTSLLGFNKTFLDATLKSGGVIEESTGNFDQGMSQWITSLGMSTGVQSEIVLGLMAENRQMVNAVGGISNAIHLTGDSILSMRGFYGGLEESMKATLGIMSEFSKKGVEPTTDALNAYNKDLTMLSMQTGMAPTAINAMIDAIADDADSITLLRGAREGEREALLASERALLKNNIALGMSAEQAAEAAKMLNKMVAQKPLDRLKQAAKMRAMGAAMGLGSEANAAADAMTAGKRATPEQRAALNDFNVKMTGMADQSAQQGMPQELFVSTMLDKLDMNEYYGSNSPFSATLGNIQAVSTEILAENYKSSSDSNIIAINNVADISLEILNTLMSGNLIWNLIAQSTRYTGELIDSFLLGFGDIGGFVGRMFDGDVKSYTDVAMPSNPEDTTNTAVPAKTEAKTAPPVNAEPKPNSTPIEAPLYLDNLTDDQKRRLLRAPAPTAEEKKKTDDEHAAKIKTRMEQASKEPTPNATPAGKVEAPVVKVLPDPLRDSATDANTNTTHNLLGNQVELVTQQNSKIDQQLSNMVSSNQYLKIIADTNPILVDLAEKQLAVSTMNQEQRDKLASRMSSESAKFSANYSYSI